MPIPKSKQRGGIKLPPRGDSIETALKDAVKKIGQCRALQKGTILVRATGTNGGDFYIDCSEKGARLVKGTPLRGQPLLQISGDARRIRGVLAGQKDARTHFLAGGFRLRGNLRYASDLGIELGLLKEPL